MQPFKFLDERKYSEYEEQHLLCKNEQIIMLVYLQTSFLREINFCFTDKNAMT
jgi:hypothetical protein